MALPPRRQVTSVLRHVPASTTSRYRRRYECNMHRYEVSSWVCDNYYSYTGNCHDSIENFLTPTPARTLFSRQCFQSLIPDHFEYPSFLSPHSLPSHFHLSNLAPKPTISNWPMVPTQCL